MAPNTKTSPYIQTHELLRVKNLGQTIQVHGKVLSSEEYPTVTEMKYECPSCGAIFTSERNEPRRCSCGRRGSFRLLDKTYTDALCIDLELKNGKVLPVYFHGEEFLGKIKENERVLISGILKMGSLSQGEGYYLNGESLH